MKSRFLTTKTFLLVASLLSILIFVVFFSIFFQLDQKHFSETGNLTWAHLTYAMDLKDDMGTIDWSKSLESFENVLAFQANQGSQIVAQGGNRNLLPANSPVGASYQFPSTWVFHQNSLKGQGNSRDFMIVFRSVPGPFLGGLYAFLASLFTLGICFWFLISPNRVLMEQGEFSEPHLKEKGPAQPGDSLDPAAMEMNGAFLFLDKQFVIRRVSPEAAALLKKNSDGLLGRHLFDLGPHPPLMVALEKVTEAKVLNPFKNPQVVSALLKPDHQGTLLILEPFEETETPQKH